MRFIFWSNISKWFIWGHPQVNISHYCLSYQGSILFSGSVIFLETWKINNTIRFLMSPKFTATSAHWHETQLIHTNAYSTWLSWSLLKHDQFYEVGSGNEFAVGSNNVIRSTVVFFECEKVPDLDLHSRPPPRISWKIFFKIDWRFHLQTPRTPSRIFVFASLWKNP